MQTAPSTAPGSAADRLALLLESTGEGIFGVDMDGRCTFVNRAAAQMLGRRTEDVLGCNMHELMHHSHADGRHYPESDCPIFNAFRQGLPCRIAATSSGATCTPRPGASRTKPSLRSRRSACSTGWRETAS